MKKLKFLGIPLVMIALISIACSEDKPNPKPIPDKENGKYVLLTAEGIQQGAGYYAVYDKLPSGEVDNIGGFSLQARSYGGFRTYKNWIYNRSSLSGEAGVVAYEVGKDGKLNEKGFIKCDNSSPGTAQNTVVNDQLGFYFDPGRGKDRIQKFNPSTMQRIGEIDLSASIPKGKTENIFTGNQTLAYKEGKLFANVTYSIKDGSGHNDNTHHYTMAVIDVATEKVEKIIVLDFAEIYNQGHSPSEYPARVLGDDGNLYFISTGWDTNEAGDSKFRQASIFRIKKGETDFDKNWLLKSSDINSELTTGIVWSMGYYKGKLFVEASEHNVASFSDLGGDFVIYSVDIESKTAAKLDVPSTVFGHSAGNFYRAGDRLFVRIVNEGSKYNGLYIINEDAKTASPAFNVVKGGKPMGFTRLEGN